MPQSEWCGTFTNSLYFKKPVFPWMPIIKPHPKCSCLCEIFSNPWTQLLLSALHCLIRFLIWLNLCFWNITLVHISPGMIIIIHCLIFLLSETTSGHLVPITFVTCSIIVSWMNQRDKETVSSKIYILKLICTKIYKIKLRCSGPQNGTEQLPHKGWFWLFPGEII